MDIYVDGSVSTSVGDNNSKRGKARQRRGIALGGSGFAIITEDTVIMKGFKCPATSTLMETVALAAALRIAKTGDTVYTDQRDLVDRLNAEGDTNAQSSNAKKNRKRRLASINVKLYMAREQVNRALQNLEGVTIAYYSSAEAKKQPMNKPGRLADRMAGVASGMQTISKNVVAAIGNREVIVR